MGSKERKRDSPIVKVTISSAFHMLEAPVTRGQWRRVMGTAPWESHGLSSIAGDESIPATWIGFAETQTFCEQFKRNFGTDAFLPSEAQWEYAYRAGTQSKWFWGDDRSKAPMYAVFTMEHERGELCSTRTRKPNAWHLYDMAGLVYEWVYGEYEQDTLTPYVKLGTYPSEAVDFVARGGGVGRMIRGGHTSAAQAEAPLQPKH